MKVKIIKADTAEELERRINKWLEEEPKGIDRSILNTAYLCAIEGLLAIVEYRDVPISFTTAKRIN